MHLFHHQFKNVLVLLSAVCFGTVILHGNQMLPSLENDWMQIVHTPPCLCQQFVDIWKRFGNLCHNEMIIIHQFHHFWQFLSIHSIWMLLFHILWVYKLLFIVILLEFKDVVLDWKGFSVLFDLGLILAQNGYFYCFLPFFRQTNRQNMSFIGI